MLSSRAAAKLPGAPSRQALDKALKRQPPPAWSCRDAGGAAKVDETSPAWAAYLRERTALALPPATVAAPDRMSYADARAENERLKGELLKIKIGREIGQFVDAERMRYYFSYFPRAFSDEVSTVKRILPEVKSLLLAGEDGAAQKRLIAEIQRVFYSVMDALQDEIKRDENTREGP